MKNEKSLTKKITCVTGAIYALASSILTEIICGAMSSSSFQLEHGNEIFIFSECPANRIPQVAIVILVFLVTWLTATMILPLIIRIRNRFTYDEIKPTPAENLIEILGQAENTIGELHTLFSRSNNSDENTMLLQRMNSTKIFQTILMLQQAFCAFGVPDSKISREVVDCFRHVGKTTVEDIRNKISPYEYISTIYMLESMVKKLQNNAQGDIQLLRDCNAAIESLSKLKEVYKRIDSEKKH